MILSVCQFLVHYILSFSVITKHDVRESYEIIYSQHMWLCTSPAYDTVHMRSIVINIRLYINSGHLSLSHSLTQSHRQTVRLSADQSCSPEFPRLCIASALFSLISKWMNSCFKRQESYSPGSGTSRDKNTCFSLNILFFLFSFSLSG